MNARDIMTMPVVVTPDDKIWRAAELMKYEKVACVLVVEDAESQRLQGLLTDRDISVRCTARRHGNECTVREHMTPLPIHTVTPDADVSVIVAKMEHALVRRIPVVDGEGRLMGVVSEGDLVTRLPDNEALPLHRELWAALRPPVIRIDPSRLGNATASRFGGMPR